MAGKSKKNKHKAEARVLGEMQDQLLLQAEKLGIEDDYNSLNLCEMETEAFGGHLSAFYAERSNLKYEMQIFGTNKKDILIKLERLEAYIKRAQALRAKCVKEVREMLEELTPNKEQARKLLEKRPKISVRIG